MSKVSQHFNEIAINYDAYKSPVNLYYAVLKKAVRQQITHTDIRVLDIGCGTGNILDFLRPKSGVGVDISSSMIKIAKRKFASIPMLKFYVHDIEQKSVRGSFDYILFNDVIEHVINKAATIKNIAASMGKNTVLVLSMANPIWEPVLMLLERLHLKMPEGPHERILESQLISILGKYRLRIISKQIYFPHIRWPFLKDIGLIYVYQIKKFTP